MRSEEAVSKLCEKEFLDKLYGFAYKRSNTSFEAEDLCSDIILTLIDSLHKVTQIESFNGFVWTVAHRVYAEFCKKQSRQKYVSYTDNVINAKTETIEDLIDNDEELSQLKGIIREISFLAKIYRDVMVMYYIDELSVSEIAKRLGISKTAVKQRLFSARNTIKKETAKMEKSLTLKPVDIGFVGTGNPVGNDPSQTANRILSKNVVYLCRKEALSAKEISEKLSVPMPFIEDELEILSKGVNGEYGLIRKLENGKFISNIVVLEYEEFEKYCEIYKEYLDEFIEIIDDSLKNHKEKLENLPFLNPRKDISFITWALIGRMVFAIIENMIEILSDKYLKDIKVAKRAYTLGGISRYQDREIKLNVYGYDGVGASNLCGYKTVDFMNLYGNRIDRHYSCGHNLSTEPQFIMLLRSIKGLDVGTLNESEKEIVAKAIESGLIEKTDNILYPKVLVIGKQHYNDLILFDKDFNSCLEPLCDKIAKKASKKIKSDLPKHLLNEYPMWILLTTISLTHHVIEKCIERGVLKAPANRMCAEGSLLVVEE